MIACFLPFVDFGITARGQQRNAKNVAVDNIPP
jgi:hypothetical protein